MAFERIYSTPAMARNLESAVIPTFLAISSAILKPIPSISSASLYGLVSIIVYILLPYSMYIFAESFMLIPNFCKKIIASRMDFFSCICSLMDLASFSLTPFTSASLSGSSSITLRVSILNFLTILFASASPTPFIAEDSRYFCILSSSLGSMISYSSTKSCSP